MRIRQHVGNVDIQKEGIQTLLMLSKYAAIALSSSLLIGLKGKTAAQAGMIDLVKRTEGKEWGGVTELEALGVIKRLVGTSPSESIVRAVNMATDAL